MAQQLATDSSRILTLEQRLTQLQALVDQQQAQMIAQSAEIEHLREQARATANTAPLIADTRPRRKRRVGEHERRVSSPSSRRALLKWGGAAAAAATVALAVGEGQSAQAAPANNGDPILAGQTTVATSTTILEGSGFGVGSPQLTVYGNWAFGSADAIHGVSDNGGGTGVSGFSNSGTGVSGSTSSGNGVFGSSNSGTGVYGTGGPYGVWGTGGTYGVYGSSSTFDLAAGGTGRILQKLQGGAGAPASGSYGAGEQIRDSNGDLYICVNGGTPGAWKKVTAVPAGTAGGADVLFPAPFRVFDTRAGVGALGGGGPMSPGQIITVQVTGTVDPKNSSIVVPAGATGIIGDLIAITASGSGFLGIQPSTGSGNPYAWINYEANVTIHNSVVVGLSSGGAVDIQCNQASAGAALTITGYII